LYKKRSKQLFKNQILVAGAVIEGVFICQIDIKKGNTLNVEINIEGQEFVYGFTSGD
jgi:hypothetical protein